MLEITCVVNFILAYTADYLYAKLQNNKCLGLIVFAFGFANFLSAIILLGKLIRSE